MQLITFYVQYAKSLAQKSPIVQLVPPTGKHIGACVALKLPNVKQSLTASPSPWKIMVHAIPSVQVIIFQESFWICKLWECSHWETRISSSMRTTSMFFWCYTLSKFSYFLFFIFLLIYPHYLFNFFHFELRFGSIADIFFSFFPYLQKILTHIQTSTYL